MRCECGHAASQPESGWVSFYIREPEDVEKAIALLRRSYDLAVSQKAEARVRETR